MDHPPPIGFGKLENPVQHYAWGSQTLIPQLLGQPTPAPRPVAEVWMGAHPRGSSKVLAPGDGTASLLHLISQDPAGMLGPQVAARFGGHLPFLFKLLAADRALSIQAHPNLAQARAGFARETAAGIPLHAPQRSYRDTNHKPEILCALTPFWGLKGFRPPAEIQQWLAPLALDELTDARRCLHNGVAPPDVKAFLAALLALPHAAQRRVAELAAAYAAPHRAREPVWDWVARLREQHPHDIGVLAPLFLNLVCLQPGEAIYTEAGELHAYLSGMGVELMANSDNVLRGGLTDKHNDAGELLAILNLHGAPPTIIRPRPTRRGEWHYATPVQEFALWCVEVGRAGLRGRFGHSLRVWLCVAGAVRLSVPGVAASIALGPGESAVVPARLPACRLTGRGTVFLATVPAPATAAP